jgi:hypothetical protein
MKKEPAAFFLCVAAPTRPLFNMKCTIAMSRRKMLRYSNDTAKIAYDASQQCLFVLQSLIRADKRRA